MTKSVVTPQPRIGYRVSEVVALTRLSERHVRRLIADGTLDTFKVGRVRFIRPESIAHVFDGWRETP